MPGARSSGEAAVFLVDPATGSTERLSFEGTVLGLRWLRGGEMLVIAAADGSIQLWDPDTDEPLGQLYRSVDQGLVGPVELPGSDEVWLAGGGGDLLRMPIEPDGWVERACEVVGRDLTQAEWDRYVPGGGEVVSACVREG